ncbi:hypothetical protein GEMRC1_006144 [Eukaryota sp. GEM-RC1]
MRTSILFLLSVFVAISICSPPSPLRNTILIIHDSSIDESDFDTLQGILKGYTLDFAIPDDEVQVKHLGSLVYDFIVFVCSEYSSPAANLDWDQIPDLIEEGVSVMFVLSEDIDDELETTLLDIGFSVPDEEIESKEFALTSLPARALLTRRSKNRLIVLDDVNVLTHPKSDDEYSDLNELFDFFTQEKHHFLVSSDIHISPQQDNYKVGDEIEVCCLVQAYDGASANYKTVSDDSVFASLKLVEEYLRVPMKFNVDLGKHCGKLTLPQKYGVFTLNVEHDDVFDGQHLVEKSFKLLPVRPLRHDEYERWILKAYPYYAAVLVEIIVFIVFVVFLLYTNLQ